jgi:hypothetical protein
MDDEEEDEESERRDGEDTDDGSNTETTFVTEFSKRWGWISNVDAVAHTINTDWDTVFNKNVVEFLNILSYTKDKTELEKQQQKQFQNKLKQKTY